MKRSNLMTVSDASRDIDIGKHLKKEDAAIVPMLKIYIEFERHSLQYVDENGLSYPAEFLAWCEAQNATPEHPFDRSDRAGAWLTLENFEVFRASLSEKFKVSAIQETDVFAAVRVQSGAWETLKTYRSRAYPQYTFFG